MARPTKRNNTVEEHIIKGIESGLTYKFAAMGAGIALSTLKDWLKRGDEGDPDFATFSVAVRQAEVRGLDKSMKVITASKDWRAHAWILEHRFPDDYGSRSHVTVANDDEKPIAVNTVNIVLPAETETDG